MKRKITYGLLLLLLIITGLVWYCNYKIAASAVNRLYSDHSLLPYNRTGLLLGTGKYHIDSSINLFYQFRIDAAVSLMRAGKIRYVVISGDNSREDYDEPSMMRADLIKNGIDSSRIFLDYAGFRTFDSIVRAKEVFGQTELTVISQRFHNQRAIYIAGKEGVSAIGFNARDVSGSNGFKVIVREKLARVKVFVDYLFGIEPLFLGPKITIPE